MPLTLLPPATRTPPCFPQEKFGDNAAGRAVLWLAKRLAKRVGVLSRSVSASVRNGAGMLARVSSGRCVGPGVTWKSFADILYSWHAEAKRS